MLASSISVLSTRRTSPIIEPSLLDKPILKSASNKFVEPPLLFLHSLNNRKSLLSSRPSMTSWTLLPGRLREAYDKATKALKQGLMQTLFSRGLGTQDADGHWVPHTDFKSTELGEIPAEWAVVAVGDVVQKLMDFRGRTPKKLGLEWGNGSIPALSANNVRMGYIDFERECYLASDELYRAWMVHGDTQRHDLVFTMEAPLGNVAILHDERKYILSQRVILMRPNQRISYRYFFQYLRSSKFSEILEVNSTGTTAKGIQQKRLVKLPVVLPAMAEQEKIADVLGTADSKLNALKEKQSKFQELKRGLMQKLLTGEWRVKFDSNMTERGSSKPLAHVNSATALAQANSLMEESL